MAEGLLACRLAQSNPEAEVASAGISALVGYPADPAAKELMDKRGIDISSHYARQLTPGMLTYFDLVLVAEDRQRDAVRSISPVACGKTHRLGKWIKADIPDPYGRSSSAFKRSFTLIDEAIESWIAKL